VLGAGGDMVALYDTEAMAWGWRSPEEVVAEEVVRRGGGAGVGEGPAWVGAGGGGGEVGAAAEWGRRMGRLACGGGPWMAQGAEPRAHQRTARIGRSISSWVRAVCPGARGSPGRARFARGGWLAGRRRGQHAVPPSYDSL
jgi:hypothetical protein